MRIRAVPEQGQLAEVRRRRYVVSDIKRSAIPRSAITAGAPQHLVSLVSIEDDALGEGLGVIWELEPGARAFEKMSLPAPRGFDSPSKLDAFLDAVRWGAASIADTKLIQAPFYSGIEIEGYQLDPVVRAVQMPRVSLLIADDVGLGKTIEAGLVVRELMLRNRSRRILVVCPATLQIKWRDEMLEKFGLDFHIVDTPLLRQLRRERGLYANPWTHFPRLIVSMDYLKRETPLRLFREAVSRSAEAPGLRPFDILIIDEAHNVAPSAAGNYALDSQRTQAIRDISPHFEHKLFLTATPHNGYRESFGALLELLDSNRFARSATPDPAQVRAVMIRRLKSEMKKWDGTTRFPVRKLEHIEVDYSDEEKRIHGLLAEYVKQRASGYRDNAEKFATEFVLKLLKKRLFSSPQAFLSTLEKHREGLRRSARAHANKALQRMQEGLKVLESSAEAREAFRFANQAMAWQRVRSEWIKAKQKDAKAALADFDIPNNRSWRAFQLAFLLINIPGLTRLYHPDRSTDKTAIADLLWFPTGGGKTEAYLGLAAYTLAIRRLQPGIGGRDGENGLAVIMRYTLRLLTLQQFQRAAGLMCACEAIRRQDEKKWGSVPFRIGLWVGRKTTPNTTEQANEAVDTLRSGRRPPAGVGSPDQMSECPWCGYKIEAGQHIRVETYPGGRARTITFCGDGLGRCEFSQAKSPDEGLPIAVVDEEIYRRPPSMLIATVDKFAQMAWMGEVQTLFGEVTGVCPRHGFRSPEINDTDSHQASGSNPPVQSRPCRKLRPPDLIIQDELHLITGPLGSLVGIYEGAIDHLATWEVDGKAIRPKVIASTATVRRAQTQVNALFMREVRVFPPPGFEAGDNFFSHEVEVNEENPGRLYAGVCAPGRRLKAALIRVYVAVLAAGQTLYEKHGDEVDPFLTAVGYFNSLRELGGMRRLIDDDVRSRLTQIEARGLRPRRLMLPDAVRELTSRVTAGEIKKLLQIDMARRFPPLGQKSQSGQWPIDVLLATNMLSVGIDISRLGLMVVAGQPKSTAEYIQATGRVGRGSAGIIFTVYNWARPRDLSHYESFRYYHATFYRQVEALSVTPYSAGSMERALTGVLVSSVRQSDPLLNPNLGAECVTANHPRLSSAIDMFSRRAAEASLRPELEQEARTALHHRVDAWLQRIRNRQGGTRLGYDVARDGITVALLKNPSASGWSEFTVLNSLRDVEPDANLTFNDAGMDGSGGAN